MSGVAALILIWDFLPAGVLPRSRGKALMFFTLLGPALAAIWTALLLINDSRGPAFTGSVIIDDASFFFFFIFAGIAAAIALASQDYAKRFGDYEGEFYALVLYSPPSGSPVGDQRRDEPQAQASW